MKIACVCRGGPFDGKEMAEIEVALTNGQEVLAIPTGEVGMGRKPNIAFYRPAKIVYEHVRTQDFSCAQPKPTD